MDQLNNPVVFIELFRDKSQLSTLDIFAFNAFTENYFLLNPLIFTVLIAII